MMLYNDALWVGTSKEGAVCMPLKTANRHCLISGATGTGKTVTLQVLAESFSQAGVPVFLTDIKGDLSGLCQPGEGNDKVNQRLSDCQAQNYSFAASPVAFWDIFGQAGHPVRATVSSMGPLLLSRMLGLNDVQQSVMQLVFRIADDEGLLLYDLKDVKATLAYVGDNADKYSFNYGNIAKATAAAIQRQITVLEGQGGSQFFGEPELKLSDWLALDGNGRGVINILAADQLFLRPALYSAFMLWLLGTMYETLPEQGDDAAPKIAFFLDEAHLLFEGCSKELMDKIELTVRLIRSKGVCVFFVTQNPMDVPASVLAQLSGRVQHALRAYTPADLKVVKSVAQSLRINPAFDTEQAIPSLKTGEALVSFLMEDGAPMVTQRAWILPPQSHIGAIPLDKRREVIDASPFKGKYETPIDRASAYELLSARYANMGVTKTQVMQPVPQASEIPAAPVQQGPVVFKVYDPASGQYVTAQRVPEVAPAAPAPAVQPQQTVYAPQPSYPVSQQPQMPVKEEKPVRKTRAEKSFGEKMLDSFTTSTATGAGRELGRKVTRNLLGMLGIK